ncbi:ankyrin repeat domain-containing protein [Nocardia farcinica]|uniref:ankyrin repeat domain-containing protein n=1 Tax=Nocardia farcinica TaxID=37329 RepID=UPI001892E00E|nr:ankyrin repeat domain-containing protein [Nocardia farcinica]MBF6254478.1 ankyrin repeat domain-containing protein [Nocardia farcinica]MBF6260214.1 ankyrin repeat domain-containing protein [Nocardia farcinica]MBF6445292.1 ankyrin repeat domain-containing protein [Nocardia farcinica]MBF6522650.1 ankyrin repeat domain-containing protein [Nocardia farcinica]
MPQRDEWGRTRLHYAARDTDLDAIDQLLQAGEDVDARDHEGWTPLHFAAQEAHPAAVQKLLDAGADVNAVTEKGMPAIYWAATAASGDPIATIRLLRARGADPTRNTIKSYFGLRSPLHYLDEVTNRPDIKAEFADLL